MTDSFPATAVVRVAVLNFDPSLFAEVDALAMKQAEYLIPAIKGLPGFNLTWHGNRDHHAGGPGGPGRGSPGRRPPAAIWGYA
jgi:hypothetical protein